MLLMGCSSSFSQNDVPPKPTPIVSGTDYCDEAEANLVKLSCEDAKPSPDGKSFTEVCKETQASGIALDPECISKIVKCEQIDCCTNTSVDPKLCGDL